jgi:hypothetical protein
MRARVGQQLLPQYVPERREVLTVESAWAVAEAQERPTCVAPQLRWSTPDERAYGTPRAAWDKPSVGPTKPLVPGCDPVPVVAEEELVGSLPGKHDLDLAPRERRDEVEEHARWERDRLVLVPDQRRQGLEHLLACDRHIAVV